MTAATPGQAAYLAWYRKRYPNARPEMGPGSWANFDEQARGWWEAAAEAAIDHYCEHSTDEERDLAVTL